MRYKRKGIDFCASPGCLRQDYGGNIGELVYCSEHIVDEMPEPQYQRDLAYCKSVAEGQGVKFGKIASS